jgi:hypothetical protein
MTKLKVFVTHLPGVFWHAILFKVEGFFDNFEKSLLHAILPEVYLQGPGRLIERQKIDSQKIERQKIERQKIERQKIEKPKDRTPKGRMQKKRFQIGSQTPSSPTAG